jgi:protein-disulfide isomerase
MSTPSPHKKRTSLSPFLHLLIPVAFILGLGCGYLLWGSSTTTAVTGETEIQRVEVSTDDDPSIGPEDAPVTIIEFGDYTCYYCRIWNQEVFNQLMASYPDQIRFVYRDLPIIGAEAMPAAEAASCAGEQGAYWEYHADLFSEQYELGRTAYEQYASDLGLDLAAFTACLDDHRMLAEAKADAADARIAGLSSTPSFIINGRILIGALPLEEFQAVIDEELAAQQ